MTKKTAKQEQKKARITGHYLLLTVLSGYALLFYFYPDKTIQAALQSFSTLQHLLPVFIVVIVLMAIFSVVISAAGLDRWLGNESGIRGWFIALIGGILSHGSSYLWYQMLADLRKQNMKDGLIITFLYARAIKLPWLPLMISYFGYAFTLLLMFYIIIGALIQGLIAEKIKPLKQNKI